MCHTPSDRPNIRQVGGAAHTVGDRVLRAHDGARFDAYLARSNEPNTAAIVVLPDSNGLSPFYRDLAERFAAEGINAIAIDYYGRTAGLGARPENFNGDDHMAQTTPKTVDQDVAAAAEYLRSDEGGAAKTVFTVGFCFGGAVSWRQSARGLDGAIGFYGSGAALSETVPNLKDLKAPLLLLVAEADPYFTIDDSRRIDRELTAAGVEHETVVYPGAPHGFFSSGEWTDISEDAWRRTLSFVRGVSG